MRQGIKYSIVTYVFMGISILASLTLYPLDTDLYGTLSFFIDFTQLLIPFVLLGLASVTVKFFPEMKEISGGGNRLFSAALIVIIICTGIMGVIGFVFYPWISQFFIEKSKLLEIDKSLWLFIPFVLLIAIQNFLIPHIANFRLIAVPNLIQNMIRISLPLIFILVFWGYVTPIIGLCLLILHYILVDFSLIVYLSKRDSLRFDIGKRTLAFLKRKDVRTFAVFAMLTGIGSGLAFKLDSLMVTSILGTSHNGIYNIGNKIGGIIAVPASAIIGIVAPILSSAMKEKRFGDIGKLYVRSSEILSIAGVFMLAGLAVIAKDLFMLMHEGENLIASGALQVVALIAFARFIDLCTSINGYIIGLSEFFRYNLYFLMVLAVGNATLNILLIPRFGITGAAMASCASLFLYNALKVVFIKLRFKMWPFNYKMFLILCIGGTAVFIVLTIETYMSWGNFSGIVFKGVLVSLLIFLGLYLPAVSDDFNHAVNVAYRRVKAMF